MNQISIQTLMTTSNVGFGTSGARGLVSDMTDNLCYAYTAAFLQQVVGDTTGKIVLGHDLRPSSPRMAAACASAIRDLGFEVIYAGALPTPALAYYGALLQAPTLIVTGSHIPYDRNGLKFYRADGEISKQDEHAIRSATVNVPAHVTPVLLPNPDIQVHDAYIARYVDFFGTSALAGRHVAIYEHSSVARDILRDILQRLGAKVISLGRTDTFVPIDTEAVRPEDVAQAQAWATTYTFDAILSTDGDADRPLIGDENGQWLRGDLVGLLCAQYLQANIIVTPVSSNTAVEECSVFAQVIRTRIGSPYVIAGMEQAIATESVVVGYEANGGFLLGSDIVRNGHRLQALATRDAILPMLALLCQAKENGRPLSALNQELPARYTASDRLQNFPTALSLKLIERFTHDTSAAAKALAPNSGMVVKVDLTDGLRLRFANGDIVHLRPSGNAPELRCYAEADSQDRAQQLCEDCLQRLNSEL